MTLFGVYITLGVTLPGLLLLRSLYRDACTPAEEIALATALGLAVEVFAYIGARAVGVPLLVLVWPIGTYLLFLAVPRLRRHWRASPRRERAPLWWSWSVAAIFALLVAWSALAFFRTQALAWPALAESRVDMPFHLALIGELRHHMPPTVPMVAGEPLFYHWFVYAHLAAVSWVTGVEPLVLLLRLSALPMLAAFVVLVGMTGRRVTGSWAGALLSIGGTVFVAAPSLYLGSNGAFTWGGIQDTAWPSPTQTFGALLFAPVVLLLVDLLERRRRDVGRWLLLGIFLIAVMGAKATYLPMLIAGLAAVAAVQAVRRRQSIRTTLIALVMATACLLYAQFVLFGKVRQGTIVDVLGFMRVTWAELTSRGGAEDLAPASVLGFTALYLLCWAIAWCGALGLLCRWRLLLRPAVVLMLGIGAAGLGAALLLGHPALSQLYFLRGSYPYPVIVAVHGLLVIRRRARLSLRAAACAAGVGAVAAYLIPLACGVTVPLGPDQAEIALYGPYAALLLIVLLVSAGLLLAGWRRLRVLALVTFMLAAVGLPAAAHARVLAFLHSGSFAYGAAKGSPHRAVAEVIPEGALAAARWLRAHSGPDDLVATNVHCLWGQENPCDSRQFWVSALTERRVLVEGWMYTAKNLARWRPGAPEHLGFWDEERLQRNDTAFRAPSAEVMRLLRERYGVRWLFVDERRTGPGSRIGDFATFRFRSGDYALYQVPGASA
ncbi:hypothetical protein ACSDR0_19280 [Streptosporangium sp. G11]|uniref:hypothetical protein n=1 Tax=Streptosporangium sp. G11 TaxID=3436926 RepID=UPI003EBE12E8